MGGRLLICNDVSRLAAPGPDSLTRQLGDQDPQTVFSSEGFTVRRPQHGHCIGFLAMARAGRKRQVATLADGAAWDPAPRRRKPLGRAGVLNRTADSILAKVERLCLLTSGTQH